MPQEASGNRMSMAQSVHRFHTVLRAIGDYWTQMKKAEKPGGFYAAWTTSCPGSELTLREVSWEESAERWDAVSNKVRPLARQPFHDDVHPHRGLAAWESTFLWALKVKNIFGDTLWQKLIVFDWLRRVVGDLFEGNEAPDEEIYACNKCGLTLQPRNASRSATCPRCHASDVRKIPRITMNSSDLQSLARNGTIDLEGRSVGDLADSTVNMWTCSECGRNILRPTSSGPPKTCPHCGKE